MYWENGLTGYGGLNFNIFMKAISAVGYTEQVITLIMLAYVIWLTIVFIVAYFKRVIWTSVLVVFAPVFAVMYAFGPQTKQIYSKWIREFCMNVFVQPFHLIVYTTLVGIPLRVVGGGLEEFRLFNYIYALIAISMIRPAEKYMRSMFGMDKGIANMASYDSGKQTFDAIANTVKQVAGVAASAAAAVATGGTSVAASGAMKNVASGAAKNLAEAGKNQIKMKELAGQVGDESVGGIEEKMNERMPLKENDNLQEDEEMMRSLQRNRLSSQGLSEEQIDSRLGEKGENQTQEESEENDKSKEEKDKSKEEKDKELNAANVTINASNVEMNGKDNAAGSENDNQTKEDKIGADKELEENNDSLFEVTGEEKEKEKGKATLNPFKSAQNLINSVNDIKDGRESVFDAGKRMISSSPLASKYTKFIGDKLPEGMKEKLKKGEAIGRTFEQLGGGAELYKGLNSIRDTMFVDGGAPRDWQGTAKTMDENRKKKDEKSIYNFTTNKENKEFATLQYKQEAEAKYKDPDKQQEYIDKKLEGLAKAYAPLGITNAQTAYSLKQDEKKYGYTPEEALRRRGNEIRGFERFNSNKENVVKINNAYNTNVSNVTQAIPNAQEYYNNGYDNIENMMSAQHIQDHLKTSLDMAMKLETALRNKGKVNYNGTDEKVRAEINEINKLYDKKLKGGK